MKNKEKDIRFYRTKERIYTAVIELLKLKSFDQITIKDICERATISRSGFYLHYLDKYDLVEQYQLEFMSHVNQFIYEAIEGNTPMEKIMINLLYFFKDDGTLLGLLISDKGSIEIQNQVKKTLQQNALRNIITHTNLSFDTEIERHYCITFFSNAMFGLIQDWINRGQKETPEEIVKILDRLIPYKLSLSKPSLLNPFDSIK